MQRAFLTGASGFIGRHFSQCLRELEVDVSCLVRRTSQQAHLREIGCHLLDGDVLESASVLDAVALAKPDVVFHLAGITKAIRSCLLLHI